MLDRYGIAGHIPRWRAASRFDLEIVAFVTECGARIEIRTDVEKRFKVAAITGFTAGEMEGNWQATEVGLQVNLGRETATRAAKRLIMLPPFAPAAETWARTTVESNICTKCAVSLIAARASKKASKVPDRLKRQNRFHTLFQCPNFSGRARQVIL